MNRRSFLQAAGIAGLAAAFPLLSKQRTGKSFLAVNPDTEYSAQLFEGVTWTEIGEVSEFPEYLDYDVMTFTPLSESRGPKLRGRIS